MRRLTHRHAAALAMLTLLVTGCDSQPEVDATATPAPTHAATASPDPVAATPGGRLELTGWQQTHPGATSVAVHAIEVDDDGHVLLDVEVVTGPNEVELARFSTFVVDDLDNRHDLVPPDDNPDVAVPTDSRLRATFAFDGPIDDEATHVTFAINAAGDRIVDAEDDDNPRSTGVRLAFRDIPLPGVGLDDEADRGESSDLVEATSVDVDATQTHPDGVVVTVTRLATDTRSVRIDIEVDNPTDREVRLLAGNPQLYDTPDLSSRVGPYQWAEVDETETRKLDIPSGGQASATLAFRGAIGSDVTSLTLTLNGGQGDDGDTPVPGFTIGDLPVPGRADASASLSTPRADREPTVGQFEDLSGFEIPETATDVVVEFVPDSSVEALRAQFTIPEADLTPFCGTPLPLDRSFTDDERQTFALPEELLGEQARHCESMQTGTNVSRRVIITPADEQQVRLHVVAFEMPR